MLAALSNAFKIPDLRRKIFYTLALLLVFRVGTHVPVPGVDARALAEGLNIEGGGIFGFLDMFAGGALSRFSVFAMGVGPYITASIILQLLTVVIPSLEALAKEGPEGRRKLQNYTRYGTVVLGIVQSFGTTMLARNYGVLKFPSFGGVALIVTTLTAGTVFLMWLGEKISENGLGNGVSLIIFTGIVARLPASTYLTIRSVGEGGLNPLSFIVFMILAVVVIGGVILIQEGQRRIPVQYAKRVVGRRVYGGQSTYIPLRVNQAGVMPVIFASSVLTFPLTLAQFIPAISGIERWLGVGTVGYNILYVVLTIFFTYFYTAVTFDPKDIADNMKKHGGFIPGLRPGKPTTQYLEKVLTRITLVGAIFLALIAVSPYLMASITRVPMNLFYFGGTGLLILVGVALDTMKQIEAHLVMRHYEGFMS
ncbi:MAG: preprotein translocase subunit SecY [Limnochordia bacterium]|jgi:preprotein translocase subunit SecY|nr:preprotein translocase subunit SecY [Limnochordia bacterium]MDD4519232.1 preprotein translocase subunit SecY [Limnochordia bacterium]